MQDPLPQLNVTVRMLTGQEGHLLHDCIPGVLDWPVEERWCAEFFADTRHHMAAAFLEGKIIGIASGFHYVHPDKRPELYVNEVMVAPPYRGGRIGTRLMECLFEHGRSLECHVAWLLTEKNNDAARGLYQRLGGLVSADEPVYYSFRLLAESRTNTTHPKESAE